jgi:hypothetical protein
MAQTETQTAEPEATVDAAENNETTADAAGNNEMTADATENNETTAAGENTAETTGAAPTQETEEISYHAVEKDGNVTAIWEMQGRKHLRTIDPRSGEGKNILNLFTSEHHDEA